jgi:hypothetical protein
MPIFNKKLLSLLAISLKLSSTLAKDWQEGVEDHEDLQKPHKCTHDEQEIEDPVLMDVDETEEHQEGRTLAEYSKFRSYGYYGLLSKTTSAYKTYLEKDLFPPIIDYFGAALKNKYPVSGNLKVSQSSVCGVSTPSALKNGVPADWVLMVGGENSSSLGWVASTSHCYAASGSRRPLVSYIRVNRYYMKETTDVLVHEKNMMCAMHEVLHALGFSKNHFKNWKDVKITSATLAGLTATVVVAEPLQTKLKEHFGCSSIKGAYMENSGSSGTYGSHFERRQFANEIMTSGLIHDMQMSELSLAALESTGWYAVDYTYADNYNWGKGQGCSFLTGSCSSSSHPEFCSGSSRGCTASGNSGGRCSTDSRSDGCKWIHPSTSYHCENAVADSYSRLTSVHAFGRLEQSKCFTGTLSTSSSASSTSFCFKYECSGTGLNTQLNLKLGSKTVACTREGQVSVTGYKGFINCPDPIEYCTTTGRKMCARGCMGRGTCIDGACKCNTGFKGKDCALRA